MKTTRLLSLALFFVVPHSPAQTYDLVVYGGTSAGVTAAVQADRMGKSAVLIEPSTHLGGLTSGGLGMTDSGNRAVIGGLGREFYQRVRKHYDNDSNWIHQQRADYKYYRESDDALWRFEPRVAEQIYRQMLAETKVVVVEGERLNRETGVRKNGAAITSIAMESGKTFAGRRFVDATYEGDLMAAAGVSFHVGRESNATYGETLNGVQTRNAVKHQFNFEVDPYKVPGDPSSGLLPGIHPDPPGEEGAADHRVQAYCFRMCLTDHPPNRLPVPKPDGYDPLRYEVYLRYIQKGWRTIWGNHQHMPNRKTDTNNHGGFSTDNIGMNYRWPEGSYAERDAIFREHETYQKGLLWFLVNDPRVPDDLRQNVARWGLPKDEFIDNGHWPHTLYIREGRRMVSDYVQTEADCFRRRDTPESVGMGSYNMDSHNVQRYVDAKGHVRNEGDVQISPGGPYKISYRAIRPRQNECTNLLVPAALSSSHIAFGSIRMEPVFMILGQSAATAASLSIDADVPVQQVDYAKLRARLLADKQVLEYNGPTRGSGANRGVPVASLKGIVVDDGDAGKSGPWTTSTSTKNFVGSHYVHDGHTGSGARIEFQLPVKKPGRYQLRLSYSAFPNRATNVPVVVQHSTGTAKLTVNQRNAPAIDQLWHPLGTFTFGPGKASVIVSNKDTDGHVIADAVQLLSTESAPNAPSRK